MNKKTLYITIFILFICLFRENALAKVCANPGKDGPGGTLSGIINTYYAGTSSSVSAGSKTLQ